MAESLRSDRRRHRRAYVPAVASVFLENACLGHYLVRNLSASGVLLLGAPGIPAQASCHLVLQGPGVGLMRLSGRVVRAGATEGEAGLAFGFEAVPPEVEAQLRRVVEGAYEQRYAPSVLIVDGDIGALAGLAEDVGKLGHRPLLAVTPLEAVRWLCDLETAVGTVVVCCGGLSGSSADLLAFVGEEFPAVHRVLVHGELPPQERLALYDESGACARVRRPYAPETLAAALRPGRPSHRPRSLRAS